ncbi:hypothetical protein EYC80_002220 [Monilinia laxa]|uniref:Uncharacterized protein n=1 Tax=Monilinia laxa TaxID=61186 RepID=A0A5N6K3C1_MONLA|nr:hypothetical protein EYC80_002220 [Monilinia laxa]
MSDSLAVNQLNLQGPPTSTPRTTEKWSMLGLVVWGPPPPPITLKAEYIPRLERNLAGCPQAVHVGAIRQLQKHTKYGPPPTSENAIQIAAEKAKETRWTVSGGKGIGERKTHPLLRKMIGRKLCQKERRRAFYVKELNLKRGRIGLIQLRLRYKMVIKRMKHLEGQVEEFREELEQQKMDRRGQIKILSQRIREAEEGERWKEKLRRINQLGQLMDRVYREKTSSAYKMAETYMREAEMTRWLIDNS